GIEQRRADVWQIRVLIKPLEIADRNLAGELARELERGPDLHGDSIGIAICAGTVDRQVMDAGVGDDFGGWLDPPRDLIAAAHYPGVLIVVTIFVALSRAGGESRVLPLNAVGRAFERHLEAVEALPDPERSADVGIDRQPGIIGGDVRAAGIVGRHDVT